MTPREHDALLARIDERTERMDTALTEVLRTVGALRERTKANETRLGSLESARRWGMAKDVLLTAAAAFGLKSVAGLP